MRILFLLLFACGVASAADVVKTYRSESGKYTVQVTTKSPSVESRFVATKWGPMKVTTEAYSQNSSISQAVTYTDYPAEFAKVDGMKLLQTVRDAMLKDCIKLEEELTETSNGNRFGLFFTAKMTEKNNLKAKLFWKGTRLYQVTVIGKPTDLAKAPTSLFVEKFDLKD